MRRPHAPPRPQPWRLGGALSSRHAPHHGAPRAGFGLRAQALAAVALLALVALRPALVDRAGSAVATRRARAGVTVWSDGGSDGGAAAAATTGVLPGHTSVDPASATTASLRNNEADDLLAALSDGELDLDALAAELAAESDVKKGAAATSAQPVTASSRRLPIDSVNDDDVLAALASLGDLDGPPKQGGAIASINHQPVPVAAATAATTTTSTASTSYTAPTKKASVLDDIDLDALAAAVLEEMEAEEAAAAAAKKTGPSAKPAAAAVTTAVDPAGDAPLAGGDPLLQRLDGTTVAGGAAARASSSFNDALLSDLEGDGLDDDDYDDYDDDYDDDLDLLDGVGVAGAVKPAAAAAVKPAAAAVKPAAAVAQPAVVQPAAAAAAAAVVQPAVKPAAAKPAAAKPATTSAQPPVRVLLMNRFYFGDRYARTVPQCSWGGEPLQCEFFTDTTKVADADAIAYHIPGMTGTELDSLPPLADDQPVVGVSMESDANYPLLADAAFTDKFDILSTLAPSSDVWLPYYDDAAYRGCWTAHPPPPAAGRRDAIAYVNSNCVTASGRDELVRAIVAAAGTALPLHAYGDCLNNMPASERAASKVETLKRYKFCVTIENSVARDYVSEKVYDALVAGCVPIYYGAPNVADYVPHPDAIVDVAAFDSPAAVAAELVRLSNDPAALAKKHAWRKAPDTWSPAFKRLVRAAHAAEAGEFDGGAVAANAPLPPPPPPACGAADSHMKRQCLLCQAVAEWQEAAADEEEVDV